MLLIVRKGNLGGGARYFQAHMVVILTQLPLKIILRSADYTERIAKWGTILGAFDIKYMPRTSIKG